MHNDLQELNLIRNLNPKTNLKQLEIFDENCFVCDFETITTKTKYYQEHKATTIHLGFIKNITKTKEFLFKSIDELLIWLKSNCNQDLTIYFHNLNFDGVFILDWLDNNGYVGINDYINSTPKKGNIKELYNKYKTLKLFRSSRSSSGSKIYVIEFLYKPQNEPNHRKIKVVCSFKKLVSSVASLQKLLKYEYDKNLVKSNKDFYHIEPLENKNDYPQEFIYYCKMDVETIIDSLVMFICELKGLPYLDESNKTIFNTLHKLTIASTSNYYLNANLNPNNGVFENDLYISLEDRTIADKFTNGGLTVVNKDWENKKVHNVDIAYIDINSAYPFQMTQPLPFGRQWETKEQALAHSDLVCEFIEVNCDYIKCKYNIPLIKNFKGNKVKGRYLMECKDFKGYYLRDEWELLKNHFCIVENERIINSYWLPLKPYYKEQIETLYNLRKSKKAKGEEGYIEKILMNSAYGKLATRIKFNSLLFVNGLDLDKWEVLEHINPNNPNKMSYLKNNPQVVCAPKDIPRIANKWVANYITSRTHCKLLNAMIYFGIDKFVYCDTDSIFMVGIDRDKLKGEYNDASTLGAWKLEDYIEDATIHFVRAKMYFIWDKNGKEFATKGAGISKDALKQKIDFNQSRFKYKDAILTPYRVNGGIVLIEKDKEIILNEKFEEIYKKVKDYQKQKESL